ncbi:low molecular weight phosphatase family protein [Halovulum dunhuangense]|uniref:Low molecular weight phosphatase family protein n=1 Tax=Halovulum dunhuangense TaxID=1505036 RepID=A0A849L3T6_9RHOB|nr:low molecular weight phosphatase family protein [Halovulum dunhuangense]NNU81068.1 low molecular weight phosphatase family protein [Halovulum dunhuangense]
MAEGHPSSVLFCCDYNSVRSPMAEGIMKKLHGQRIYVQSAGVRHEQEVDGFSVAVCSEIGVELTQHRTRSFEEMEEWGDQIGQYDLIVALSPASLRHAQEYTRTNAIDVEYWPIMDPTGLGETREQKLSAYRQARDQILTRIRERFPSGNAA